jgi:hypothetical protein
MQFVLFRRLSIHHRHPTTRCARCWLISMASLTHVRTLTLAAGRQFVTSLTASSLRHLHIRPIAVLRTAQQQCHHQQQQQQHRQQWRLYSTTAALDTQQPIASSDSHNDNSSTSIRSNIPDTMRAVVCTELGAIDKIEYEWLPVPSIQANQVLIKVHATTISRPDLDFFHGEPAMTRTYNRLSPLIFGAECSGVLGWCYCTALALLCTSTDIDAADIRNGCIHWCRDLYVSGISCNNRT